MPDAQLGLKTWQQSLLLLRNPDLFHVWLPENLLPNSAVLGCAGGEEDVQREFVTIYISSYPQNIGDKLSFTYI